MSRPYWSSGIQGGYQLVEFLLGAFLFVPARKELRVALLALVVGVLDEGIEGTATDPTPGRGLLALRKFLEDLKATPVAGEEPLPVYAHSFILAA